MGKDRVCPSASVKTSRATNTPKSCRDENVIYRR